jgi:hypothetical protein
MRKNLKENFLSLKLRLARGIAIRLGRILKIEKIWNEVSLE